MPSRNSMSKGDAGRIQSSQAKSGGDMSSGGFAARAQAAGDRNANANAGGYGGKSGGGGNGGSGSGSQGGSKK